MAHGVTHVVQQRSGPVDGTPAAGGIKISHPSDSFERAAENSAERVMSSATPTPVAAATPSVQRAEAEDDDEVQGMFIQREAEEDEDSDEEI